MIESDLIPWLEWWHSRRGNMFRALTGYHKPTIMCTNNEKNDQFYRKVAFLMYSERINFRPQSWKEASKLKPHRGLGTRLPSP